MTMRDIDIASPNGNGKSIRDGIIITTATIIIMSRFLFNLISIVFGGILIIILFVSYLTRSQQCLPDHTSNLQLFLKILCDNRRQR